MAKERLDVLLTARGLAESREQAQRLILAAQVLVDGQVRTKAGQRIDTAASLEVKAGPRFVSRGGGKLDAAFEAFDLDVTGLLCMDVGASTGGFVDCLLQRGAAHVVAVDVGHGQLDWRLRNDPRVTVMEKVNARYLKAADLAEPPAFASIDVSFISLTKILPAVIQVLLPGSDLVALIKPQFEAGREQVCKGGVVRDEGVRAAVAEKIRDVAVKQLGMAWLGQCSSPVHGPAGNVEILAHMRKG